MTIVGSFYYLLTKFLTLFLLTLGAVCFLSNFSFVLLCRAEILIKSCITLFLVYFDISMFNRDDNS